MSCLNFMTFVMVLYFNAFVVEIWCYQYSANRRRLQESVLLDDLRAQLEAMVPSPTAIFER